MQSLLNCPHVKPAAQISEFSHGGYFWLHPLANSQTCLRGHLGTNALVGFTHHARGALSDY
jgi:hypothetical protein